MSSNNGFWQGKRVLVTGVMGFGGGHLCEQLLERDAVVYGMDWVYPQNSYLVISGLAPHIEFIQGDVRDIDLLKLIFERFEIDNVFHLAAQPVVPISLTSPYQTLLVNVLGTFAVLEAMRTSSKTHSLVFASTGKYYGSVSQTFPVPEDQSPNKADNIYAPSKTAADITVRCYAETYGLKASVCRFINTYGPGNTNFSTIVPRAISLLMENKDYDFGGRDDGTSTFDYLHIRDMTRAYLAVAENLDRYSAEAFNFSGGRLISVRDLVKLISRLYDGEEREPVFHGPPHEVPIQKSLDWNKAHRLLGWEPSISLEDGLKETIEWYRAHWAQLSGKYHKEKPVEAQAMSAR
jgi:nucleoside-diphosphate-sugar epimerase